MYDIAIIGAGPAGLTAALYALRADKSVIVLEKGAFGGQITFSPKLENYPGTGTLSGNEFAEKLVEQVLDQGADIEPETVLSVEKKDNLFNVITEDGESPQVHVTGCWVLKMKKDLSATGYPSVQFATVHFTETERLRLSAEVTRHFRRHFFFQRFAKR